MLWIACDKHLTIINNKLLVRTLIEEDDVLLTIEKQKLADHIMYTSGDRWTATITVAIQYLYQSETTEDHVKKQNDSICRSRME